MSRAGVRYASAAAAAAALTAIVGWVVDQLRRDARTADPESTAEGAGR